MKVVEINRHPSREVSIMESNFQNSLLIEKQVPHECPHTGTLEACRRSLDSAHSKIREHDALIKDLEIKHQSNFVRVERAEGIMNEQYRMLQELKFNMSSVASDQQLIMNAISRTEECVRDNNRMINLHLGEETLNTEKLHKRLIKIATGVTILVISSIGIYSILSKTTVIEAIKNIFMAGTGVG